MKRRIIPAAIAIFLFIILTGCGKSADTAGETEIPSDAFIYDCFEYRDSFFSIRSDGQSTYLKEELPDSGTQWGYRFQKREYSRDAAAIWHENSQCIFYSQGTSVYRFDLSLKEALPVWSLSNGSKKDFVQIISSSDSHLLLRIGYGEKNHGPDSQHNPYLYPYYDLYSLDLNRFEAAPLLQKIEYSSLPVPICTRGQTVYCIDGREIICIDLITGERAQLGLLDYEAESELACGVVYKDTLFFVYDYSYTCSIPLSGGSVEYYSPRIGDGAAVALPVSLHEYRGQLFLLVWDSTTNPTATLCLWNPSAEGLTAAGTDSALAEAIGMHFSDDSCLLFSPADISVVSLFQ